MSIGNSISHVGVSLFIDIITDFMFLVGRYLSVDFSLKFSFRFMEQENVHFIVLFLRSMVRGLVRKGQPESDDAKQYDRKLFY